MAKKLCKQLNDTIGDPTNLGLETLKSHRSKIINSLLAGCSPSEIEIEPPFWCDYGFNIFIGRDFYANYNCCILGNILFGYGLSQIARKLLSGTEYPLKAYFSETGDVRT
jgi:maltose O-acetyltransferase